MASAGRGRVAGLVAAWEHVSPRARAAALGEGDAAGGSPRAALKLPVVDLDPDDAEASDVHDAAKASMAPVWRASLPAGSGCLDLDDDPEELEELDVDASLPCAGEAFGDDCFLGIHQSLSGLERQLRPTGGPPPPWLRVACRSAQAHAGVLESGDAHVAAQEQQVGINDGHVDDPPSWAVASESGSAAPWPDTDEEA